MEGGGGGDRSAPSARCREGAQGDGHRGGGAQGEGVGQGSVPGDFMRCGDPLSSGDLGCGDPGSPMGAAIP